MPFRFSLAPFITMITCLAAGVLAWYSDYRVAAIALVVGGLVTFFANDRYRRKMWAEGRLPVQHRR
jgi:hypothetical protein